MSSDPDRYEAFYANKLWELLPAHYRAADSDDLEHKGPLEELARRIGVQVAIVRRSIDRLWEDQSIETCDDWVIDYIGDLLATNLVPSLDSRGRRLDVFKTIYYRRRKGTVMLLEQLAGDITGWSARVVELFQRLGRTRHALDPAIGPPARPESAAGRLQQTQRLVGALTRTSAGGFADLRSVLGARLAGSAFDEFAHSADVRRGRGATGWYDIPRLGVFLWRLRSFRVRQVTPIAVRGVSGQTCQQYTFDPTGRNIQLFAAGRPPPGDQWVPPGPADVPGPISSGLLLADLATSAPLEPTLYPGSLALYRYGVPTYEQLGADELARDPRTPADAPWIDPVNGRIVYHTRPTRDPRVDYHYGFAAELGAGPYERPPIELPSGTQPIVGTAVDPSNPITIPSTGTVVIGNSLTYTGAVAASELQQTVVRAGDQERPLLRLEEGSQLTLRGAGDDANLLLDGVFISGGADLVLEGRFNRVTLSCCTLDPGEWNAQEGGFAAAADGRSLAPTRLLINGHVRELVIDRCICGPISLAAAPAELDQLIINESIVQAVKPSVLALDVGSGEVEISRSTLLGRAKVHRVDVSECILHDVFEVDDFQHGCVRFSAYVETDSKLPRKYESVPIAPRQALFGSRTFGNSAYAQLLASAGAAIAEGAEDGSEMGAFWREQGAVKERSLLIKYQEYLPLGLEPVVIFAT